jgi:hypothetical protein
VDKAHSLVSPVSHSLTHTHTHTHTHTQTNISGTASALVYYADISLLLRSHFIACEVVFSPNLTLVPLSLIFVLNMKAKNRPSSSNSPGPSGFISFSAVLGNTFSDSSNTDNSSSASSSANNASSSGGPSPVYTGDDVQISAIMKRMLKKDSNTRKKALLELQALIHERCSNDLTSATAVGLVHSVMDHFVYVYNQLMLDNDKSVREALNIVFRFFLQIDKTALPGPLRKAVVGWLFIARAENTAGHTQHGPVGVCANEIWTDILAPTKNRRNVLLNLCSSVVEVCRSNYLLANENSFPDASTQSQEALVER